MPEGGLNRAYLALGSNIDPEKNLPAAVHHLAEYGRVLAASRVWETVPVGFAAQPNFLNAALLLETPLSARECRLRAIADVEQRLGRIRDPGNKNAPRTIDIDLALFNQDVLQVEQRQIPDPEILERPFLAIPLAELDPAYRHPQDGRTLDEIARLFEPDVSGMKLREDVVLLSHD